MCVCVVHLFFWSDEDDPNVMQEKYGDFLEQIGISEDGIGSFGIPWKLDAKTMGVIEEKEFVHKLSEAGYTIIHALTLYWIQVT